MVFLYLYFNYLFPVNIKDREDKLPKKDRKHLPDFDIYYWDCLPGLHSQFYYSKVGENDFCCRSVFAAADKCLHQWGQEFSKISVAVLLPSCSANPIRSPSVPRM